MALEKQDGEFRSVDTERLSDVAEFISTEMTAVEVQAVIDAVASAGGGTIVWERGVHRYGETTTVGGEAAAIELKSHIRYLGCGYGTHIIQDEQDINVFATHYDDIDPDRLTAGAVENIEVAQMRLDGNKGAFSGFSSRQVNNVLWTPLVRDSYIHHLWSEDVHQHGLHPDACIRTRIADCVVENPGGQGIHMATRGIGDGNNAGPLDSSIERVVVLDAGSVGLSVDAADDGKNVVISTCTVDGADGSGISIDVTGGVVANCYVRGSTTEGYKLDGNGVDEQVALVNCVAEDIGGSSPRGALVLADNAVIDNLSTYGVARGVQCSGSNVNLTVINSNLSATDRAFYVISAASASISGSKVRNASNPIYVDGVPNVRITDVVTENGGGSTIDSDNAAIDGLTVRSSSGWHALRCQGTGMSIRGVRGESNGSANNLINLEGTDGSVSDASSDGTESNLVNTPSVRPRWEGIIGGGPIGGVNIGSLTGAAEGDLARSNGTNASATVDELFVLKSNGDWQSLADPTMTITPA